MKQICVSLGAVSKLNWRLKKQNFTRYPDANVNKFLMGVEMQFTVVFWIYI